MGERLSAEQVRGFTEHFLWYRFAEAAPIGALHMALWRLVCRGDPWVAYAAPRGHSKTTSVPKARGLACALAKQHAFQLKVAATHDLALEMVQWCRQEMVENARIGEEFGPRIVQDQKDDLIVELRDGYQFRWVAMGMNQAKRGFVWGTMRPTLIDVDDAEIDTEVLNPEIREQVKKTLYQVLVPMGGDATEIRVGGTILHQDSMLAETLKNPSWRCVRFQACDEEVSEGSLLWPQKFTRERLLKLKQLYIHRGNLAGFNMEYRNIALDSATAFFRPEDFRRMEEEDHKRPKLYYVGGDLAFSKKEKRDWTVFAVWGIDEDGIAHRVDERRGRWDGKQVIDEMYSIDETWHPQEWFIESGAIKETLGTALELRMAEEGYLNLRPGLIPTKDKAIRAMPLQARLRARGAKFDTEASWFADYRQEMLEFAQEGTRGAHDDRVDADAWVFQGLKNMSLPMTAEEEEEELLRGMRRQAKAVNDESCTGYERLRAEAWG